MNRNGYYTAALVLAGLSVAVFVHGFHTRDSLTGAFGVVGLAFAVGIASAGYEHGTRMD